jgi:2-polyprenyl-6-methoxyphenol hydroxylase-like FAD-dependent oxidoreductase
MPALKPITIVGGGLAGLTLGIGLRREKIPVTILEAGHYPRHRVCGEFISGTGQRVLARLELLEAISRAGANEAATAMFVLPRDPRPAARPLAQPALCLSRFKLDALLAARFREAGGALNEHTRSAAADEPGIVRASGRRPSPVADGSRWFGLKVHARNLTLRAGLEMHVLPQGYVGLCRLSDGEVNICGLFRRPVGSAAGGRALLMGEPGSDLHQRLTHADFDETSYCSIAGLSLRPRRAGSLSECAIGDALTMIPPVTGNGMSMAFESGELAIAPLVAYSSGQCNWEAAKQQIARACDAAFAQRLRWAQWLQWMMFSQLFHGLAGSLALRSNWIWRLMFKHTR